MVRRTPKSSRTDIPLPDTTLFRAACGIARGGAYTAILFADQRRIVGLLALGIAPQHGADVLVQPLGERLGKAVGDRFQEDTRIIVMIGAEAGQMRLDPVPGGHREAADPVALGIDEIGVAHIGPPLAPGDLLAQERDAENARANGGLPGSAQLVDS